MVTEVAEPSCFGSFQPEGGCASCAAALWCSDFTIRLEQEALEQLDSREWILYAESDPEWKEGI